jgi:cyclopropane fatty-acyl-phospholipid synthase-like methyltransferase
VKFSPFYLRRRRKSVGFVSSKEYWIRRYEDGGNSGAGSYGVLAHYKADVLNSFLEEHRVHSVIEFGCGDGNNLSSYRVQNYLGLDISSHVIRNNRKNFDDRLGHAFMIFDDSHNFPFTADVTLSFDVIFHLIEDDVFERYMEALFNSADKFVLIYSSNVDSTHEAQHVRHRNFSRWIGENRPDFRLIREIPNPYKSDLNGNDPEKSFADFFVYEKI